MLLKTAKKSSIQNGCSNIHRLLENRHRYKSSCIRVLLVVVVLVNLANATRAGGGGGGEALDEIFGNVFDV